jgi:hypothetical protein
VRLTGLDWTFATTGLADAVVRRSVISTSTATHLTYDVV